jgi:hypothetical protein
MDNYEDEIVEETIETPEEDDSTELEEVEDSEDDVEEAQEEEVDWEARAKKAEAAIIKAKSKPKSEAKAPQSNKYEFSYFDQRALDKAEVDTQEDLDEILDYASRKNISVADALKSTVIKATLDENAQIRKSAQAVNTGAGRRASGTISDERLMADAKKNIMPDNPEDIAKLALMRIGKK